MTLKANYVPWAKAGEHLENYRRAAETWLAILGHVLEELDIEIKDVLLGPDGDPQIVTCAVGKKRFHLVGVPSDHEPGDEHLWLTSPKGKSPSRDELIALLEIEIADEHDHMRFSRRLADVLWDAGRMMGLLRLLT